jgi:hypothetical protein
VGAAIAGIVYPAIVGEQAPAPAMARAAAGD